MAEMTKGWNIVRRFYAKQNAPGMLELVDAIVNSPYREGLFPWTSHLILFLTQTEVDFPYHGPRLMIDPHTGIRYDGCMEFRYIDTEIRAEQWHRQVRNEDAFARLEKFFGELNWFTRYQRALEPERKETR